MQFEMLGWLVNLYMPVRLKEDYHHEGYILIFRKPWYVLRLKPLKQQHAKTNSDDDDIPF